MARRWLLLLVLAVAASGSATALKAQTEGTLASAAPPAYPLAAKAAGIEGKVVLKGVIGTDGKVRDVQAVKGPEQLRQAAIDAVMRWAYHPYMHNGKPVETPTTIRVNFTMGGKKEKAKAQAEARAALAKASATPEQATLPAPAPHE